MPMTPEQLEQVERTRAQGQRRLTLQFTREQKESWREAVAQELVGQDDNAAHLRKIVAAAEQPGFLGDIRRAIVLSRRPLAELAAAIGVEPRLLSDFRAGEAQLPAAGLDHLLESLGLRLMQEIPH